MCPLDPNQPADDFDIPAFPAYLRQVWASHILPAYVPCQFSLWVPGPVVVGTNVGQEIVVSATPGIPINIIGIQARVKVPSDAGDIGVHPIVNGMSISGAPIVIPEGLLVSSMIVPNVPTLSNGDVLSLAVTVAGLNALDLSVHLFCQAKVTYP